MEFIEEFDTALSLWPKGELFENLETRPADEVFELAETLALIAKYHFSPEKGPNKNFSFTANSSLSGGSYPCSYPDCREKKLKELVSFASLYADEVYIQNPFEKIMLAGPESFGDAGRVEMLTGIYNYYYLKPLIESGVIKYSRNMVDLCTHHWESFAKPLKERLEEKERRLGDLLEAHLLERCVISFDIGKGAGPFLKVAGPEGLIEHGSRYLHLFGDLADHFVEKYGNKTPYKFSKKEVLDEELLFLIINPIISDLSIQEWHTSFFGTSYLCDNSSIINIATKLNNRAYAANSSAFSKALSHSLPLIYGKDLSTIVNLREREGEAFSVYRDKLHGLLKPTKNWSESEVEEAFRDQLLPEINKIDKRVRDWKEKTHESLREKLIFGSGAVSVGLYAGMLPPDIGQVIAAIGGGSAIAGALMDYNKTLKEKNEVRDSDYYFLWQMNQ